MSQDSPLILGTRGSDLALTQANMVRDALSDKAIACEIRVIRTIGDKRPDLKLSEFSEKAEGVHDKGIFTKELEEALFSGEIDFAVHSLKDVPTELADCFEICSTLPRAPINDVILTTDPELAEKCTRYQAGENGIPSNNGLFAGKTVATSSVRRAAQLRWLFPGVKTVDIRGNVPTRIRKLIESPDWDAIILARAGIERLGFYHSGERFIEFEGSQVHTWEMPANLFHPAASQGAVAMEIRKDNDRAREALSLINDVSTFAQITAERSFLAALKAGCQTPVGICAGYTDNGDTMTLDTVVFSESDLSAAPRQATLTLRVEEAGDAGRQLLERLA